MSSSRCAALTSRLQPARAVRRVLGRTSERAFSTPRRRRRSRRTPTRTGSSVIAPPVNGFTPQFDCAPFRFDAPAPHSGRPISGLFSPSGEVRDRGRGATGDGQVLRGRRVDADAGHAVRRGARERGRRPGERRGVGGRAAGPGVARLGVEPPAQGARVRGAERLLGVLDGLHRADVAVDVGAGRAVRVRGGAASDGAAVRIGDRCGREGVVGARDGGIDRRAVGVGGRPPGALARGVRRVDVERGAVLRGSAERLRRPGELLREAGVEVLRGAAVHADHAEQLVRRRRQRALRIGDVGAGRRGRRLRGRGRLGGAAFAGAAFAVLRVAGAVDRSGRRRGLREPSDPSPPRARRARTTGRRDRPAVPPAPRRGSSRRRPAPSGSRRRPGAAPRGPLSSVPPRRTRGRGGGASEQCGSRTGDRGVISPPRFVSHSGGRGARRRTRAPARDGSWTGRRGPRWCACTSRNRPRRGPRRRRARRCATRRPRCPAATPRPSSGPQALDRRRDAAVGPAHAFVIAAGGSPERLVAPSCAGRRRGTRRSRPPVLHLRGDLHLGRARPSDSAIRSRPVHVVRPLGRPIRRSSARRSPRRPRPCRRRPPRARGRPCRTSTCATPGRGRPSVTRTAGRCRARRRRGRRADAPGGAHRRRARLGDHRRRRRRVGGPMRRGARACPAVLRPVPLGTLCRRARDGAELRRRFAHGRQATDREPATARPPSGRPWPRARRGDGRSGEGAANSTSGFWAR